jgi:hypothetical protein
LATPATQIAFGATALRFGKIKPPGVPYEQQQFYAQMSEHGILDVTPESQAALAARIRANITGGSR